MKFFLFILLCTIILLLAESGCQYTTFSHGKETYEKHCAPCHMSDGKGLENVIPNIKSSQVLTDHPEKLACIIRTGIQDSIWSGKEWIPKEMPGFKEKEISDIDLTNLINYLLESWNPDPTYFSRQEIQSQLGLCH